MIFTDYVLKESTSICKKGSQSSQQFICACLFSASWCYQSLYSIGVQTPTVLPEENAIDLPAEAAIMQQDGLAGHKLGSHRHVFCISAAGYRSSPKSCFNNINLCVVQALNSVHTLRSDKGALGGIATTDPLVL